MWIQIFVILLLRIHVHVLVNVFVFLAFCDSLLHVQQPEVLLNLKKLIIHNIRGQIFSHERIFPDIWISFHLEKISFSVQLLLEKCFGLILNFWLSNHLGWLEGSRVLPGSHFPVFLRLANDYLESVFACFLEKLLGVATYLFTCACWNALLNECPLFSVYFEGCR